LASADEVLPVDIVIANAGIGGRITIAPPEGETNIVASLIFATNTLGVINTATPIIPRFVRRRAGHFVVVSSLAGLLGLPHSPAYCGSKAAVRIYAEGLRRLMRPHGVRVTVVNPGFIDTPMSRSLPHAGPQIWSADRAARAVKSAIEKGKREFTFPWPLRLAVGATRVLPTRLVDAVLAKAHRGWTIY
jgi:short-subunit dehydrogenase